MQLSIVIADDHQVVLAGFRSLLAAEPGFVIVGEANNGQEALALVEQLRPDVLVLDLMMPGLHGLDVIRALGRREPAPRIAVISMNEDLAYVTRALANGALAYVLKSAPANELVQAVRTVAQGMRYLSPPLSEDRVQDYQHRVHDELELYDVLTHREKEVLTLTAQGLSNVEMGRQLCISKRTVESHRASVMRKMGFSSHADLIRYAHDRGLVPLR